MEREIDKKERISSIHDIIFSFQRQPKKKIVFSSYRNPLKITILKIDFFLFFFNLCQCGSGFGWFKRFKYNMCKRQRFYAFLFVIFFMLCYLSFLFCAYERCEYFLFVYFIVASTLCQIQKQKNIQNSHKTVI